MRKLINEPGDVPGDALEGLTRTAAGVARLAGSDTAVRRDIAEARAAGLVAVVSGDGAGHEPAHAGYVGAGMLSAAVAGPVLGSPAAGDVLDAIRAVAAPAGVLLVVPDFPAARLSFALAADLARAEGIPVAVVPVGDDVAARRDGAGRRGAAGVVLVHKVAGAAAAAGRPLAEVAELAGRAASGVATTAVALGPGTTPAAVPITGTAPLLELPFDPDEVEWGRGVNGEPGLDRGPAGSADEIAARLVATLLQDPGIAPGRPVALLVNGLGATPPTELSIVAAGALRALGSSGVPVTRVWTGTFLTAMDTPGVSLSLLALDDDLRTALDAPASAPAWPHTTAPAEPGVVPRPAPAGPAPGTLAAGHPLRRVLEGIAEALISVRDELTTLDLAIGGGDVGLSLARGAAAVLAECPDYPGADGPAAVLRALAGTVRRSVDGMTGPLHTILLLRAASVLPADPQPRDWAAALHAAVAGIREATGAEPGDRTLLDALAPAAAAFTARLDKDESWVDALAAAADAADEGAAATVDLPPLLGRSRHLGVRVLGYPDTGARAVAICLRATAQALRP